MATKAMEHPLRPTPSDVWNSVFLTYLHLIPIAICAAPGAATGQSPSGLASHMRPDHPMRALVEADWIEQDAEFALGKTEMQILPPDQPVTKNLRGITTATITTVASWPLMFSL